MLVVPEVYGPFFDRLPTRPRLVVFNQNAYMTYNFIPTGESPRYDIFSAAMTVSHDSAEYLRFAFAALDVSVVPNSIDPALFHPRPDLPDRVIATMPRKRIDDATQILRLLGDHLRGWRVEFIEDMTEAATATALRSAPLFLALGRQEGFGLPPAEAMASGCYVIGFAGIGGREIFDPSYSSPVEDEETSLQRPARSPGSPASTRPIQLRSETPAGGPAQRSRSATRSRPSVGSCWDSSSGSAKARGRGATGLAGPPPRRRSRHRRRARGSGA